MAEQPSLISTDEMSRRAGVTFRRLDMWVRTGKLAPAVQASGSGTGRRWFEWQIGEVVEVREQMRPYLKINERGRP